MTDWQAIKNNQSNPNGNPYFYIVIYSLQYTKSGWWIPYFTFSAIFHRVAYVQEPCFTEAENSTFLIFLKKWACKFSLSTKKSLFSIVIDQWKLGECHGDFLKENYLFIYCLFRSRKIQLDSPYVLKDILLSSTIQVHPWFHMQERWIQE